MEILRLDVQKRRARVGEKRRGTKINRKWFVNVDHFWIELAYKVVKF